MSKANTDLQTSTALEIDARLSGIEATVAIARSIGDVRTLQTLVSEIETIMHFIDDVDQVEHAKALALKIGHAIEEDQVTSLAPA